jgi:hypothetical protein
MWSRTRSRLYFIISFFSYSSSNTGACLSNAAFTASSFNIDTVSFIWFAPGFVGHACISMLLEHGIDMKGFFLSTCP